MWKIYKSMKFDAAHKLENYDGACANIHGHTFKVDIECKHDTVDKIGLIIDFKILKLHMKEIIDELDHSYLNDIVTFNPTAENLAKYIYEELKKKIEILVKVRVWESETAYAEYYENE